MLTKISIIAPVSALKFFIRLYQLVSADNAETKFWETMQDFAEKLFLVPAPPKGMLAVVS